METQSPCWWESEYPTKWIQERPSPVDDSEEALGIAAPTWTEVAKKKTARKNSPPQGEQINGAKGVENMANAKP